MNAPIGRKAAIVGAHVAIVTDGRLPSHAEAVDAGVALRARVVVGAGFAVGLVNTAGGRVARVVRARIPVAAIDTVTYADAKRTRIVFGAVRAIITGWACQLFV